MAIYSLPPEALFARLKMRLLMLIIWDNSPCTTAS